MIKKNWKTGKNIIYTSEKIRIKAGVFNFFLKSEPGHVLKMFLNFQQISGWCSYKFGSYKKKVYYTNKANKANDAFSCNTSQFVD